MKNPKNRQLTSEVWMICQECGAEIDSNEYHPYNFYVLIKAGIDPTAFVQETILHLPGGKDNEVDRAKDRARNAPPSD